MSLTVLIYYTGKNGLARKFAEEMEQNGTANLIREEAGNEQYEYFLPKEIYPKAKEFAVALQTVPESIKKHLYTRMTH